MVVKNDKTYEKSKRLHIFLQPGKSQNNILEIVQAIAIRYPSRNPLKFPYKTSFEYKVPSVSHPLRGKCTLHSKCIL